jgi:hypothetical protein
MNILLRNLHVESTLSSIRQTSRGNPTYLPFYCDYGRDCEVRYGLIRVRDSTNTDADAEDGYRVAEKWLEIEKAFLRSCIMKGSK